MTSWVNFRDAPLQARNKMKKVDKGLVENMERCEKKSVDPIWVCKEDFPYCLDGVKSMAPEGAGAMFKRAR